MPADTPITSAPAGPTNPDAGVIVPRPATIPVTAPSALGLPNRIHSATNHTKAPADAEMCVTSIAIAASPFAASALPPLKPNQPTHNMPAPATVNVMLCGGLT